MRTDVSITNFLARLSLPLSAAVFSVALVLCAPYGAGWHHNSRSIQVSLKFFRRIALCIFSIIPSNTHRPLSFSFFLINTSWKGLNSFMTKEFLDNTASKWGFQVLWQLRCFLLNCVFLIIAFQMLPQGFVVFLPLWKETKIIHPHLLRSRMIFISYRLMQVIWTLINKHIWVLLVLPFVRGSHSKGSQ